MYSSTPHDSELIEVNTLFLNEAGSGLEQLIILNGQAMSGSSVTVLDSRTMRVHLAIEDDFFLTGAIPKAVELLGFAKVKDIALGPDAPSLSTQFVLELSVTDIKFALASSGITASMPTDTTLVPTITPLLGAKVCQCDGSSNECLSNDIQISFASKDDIHICIT